jgi:hypothetical protein
VSPDHPATLTDEERNAQVDQAEVGRVEQQRDVE